MTRPLALDRTCCQSCLPVLLQPEEHNDQWYDTQQRTEHDCTSLRSKVGHHAIQTQGHGLVFFRGHHHQRQEEVIPCCDEDEEENGDHCRSQNTQNHGEEDTCFRCPVNAGRFDEFCGNRVLRINASKEQSKGADTRRDDDRPRVSVIPILWKTRYSGIVSNAAGISKPDMTTARVKPRPGKANFAIA